MPRLGFTFQLESEKSAILSFLIRKTAISKIMPTLNPNFLKIGYVILASTPKLVIQKLQRNAGYGEVTE